MSAHLAAWCTLACSEPSLSCGVIILLQAADPQHLLLAAVPFSERAGTRVLLVYDASGTGEVSKQGSCALGVGGHAWLGRSWRLTCCINACSRRQSGAPVRDGRLVGAS